MLLAVHVCTDRCCPNICIACCTCSNLACASIRGSTRRSSSNSRQLHVRKQQHNMETRCTDVQSLCMCCCMIPAFRDARKLQRQASAHANYMHHPSCILLPIDMRHSLPQGQRVHREQLHYCIHTDSVCARVQLATLQRAV
jgi:hypothetical protein